MPYLQSKAAMHNITTNARKQTRRSAGMVSPAVTHPLRPVEIEANQGPDDSLLYDAMRHVSLCLSATALERSPH